MSSNNQIILLEHQIIPELPYTWHQALIQGDTGVIATPSQSQTNNIIKLAKNLVPVIKLLNTCSINSWLRTPVHNALVGGSIHSQHLLGNAVDLHPIFNTVADCKALLKTMANRVLFMELNTTNWLHLDQGHKYDFIA